MANQLHTQHSFSGGALDPKVTFRSDTQNYQSSVKTADNVFLHETGAASKRNGLLYTAETKDSSDKTRFIEFKYSREISQVLELGDEYVRFYNEDGQVLNPTTYTLTSLTKVDSNTIEVEATDIGTDLTVGQQVYLTGHVSNYLNLNTSTKPYTVASTPSADVVRIDLPAGASIPALTVTTPGTISIPYELESPYTIDEVQSLQYVCHLNKIYIASGTQAIQVFIRTDDDDWEIESIEDDDNYVPPTVEKAGGTPYGSVQMETNRLGTTNAEVFALYAPDEQVLRTNVTGITQANPGVVTCGSTSLLVDGDTVRLTDVQGMTQVNGNLYVINVTSGTTFELVGVDTSGYGAYVSGGRVYEFLGGKTNFTLFSSVTVGDYILYNNGVIEITSVAGASLGSILGTILHAPDNTEISTAWRLDSSAWNSTSKYPECITFFDSRLWAGNSITFPTTVWGSVIGIYASFALGANDDQGISEVLNIEGEISWLHNAEGVIIGGHNSESIIISEDTSAVTPTNKKHIIKSNIGSNKQQVKKIGNQSIFISGTENKISTFFFNAINEIYQSSDLTLLADNNNIKITHITYSKHPVPRIFAVTDVGTVLAGLFDLKTGNIGWTVYKTDGLIEDIALIEQTDNDIIYVAVKRRINSAWVRNIERIEVPAPLTYNHLDSYLDSSTSYSSPITISSIVFASGTTINTSGSHGLSAGDKIIIKGITDALDSELDSDNLNASTLNNTVYTVAVTDSDTVTLKDLDGNAIVNTESFNGYISAGFLYKCVDTFYNLRHLENKTISVVGDGAYLGTQTVTDGAILLDIEIGEVVLGLPYTWEMELLEPELGNPGQSTLGQNTAWNRVLLNILNSSVPTVNEEIIPSFEDSDLLDVAPSLKTGYASYGSMNTNESNLVISSDLPLPVNLLGVSGTISLGVV